MWQSEAPSYRFEGEVPCHVVDKYAIGHACTELVSDSVVSWGEAWYFSPDSATQCVLP